MATFPGFDCYGGATITRVADGAGAEWVGCTARNLATNTFGFYVFRNGVNIPILPFCTGRGSINQDGHWIAWDKNIHYTGGLPNFVPVAGAGAGASPTPIPIGGAIANLWPHPYVPSALDTPEEVALRLSKTNAAVLELVDLLKRAGVLV